MACQLIKPLLLLPLVADNIFCSDLWQRNVYMSSNNGRTLDSRKQWFRQIHYIMSLLVHGDTLFAGTELVPVYKSVNNGNSWNTG